MDKEITSLASTVAGFAQQFFSNEIDTNKLCVQGTCVTGAQLQALLAAATQSGSASASPQPPSPSEATDTPPAIQINGNNPAVIQVGASYADLGATITGPQADLKLGIQTFVNGVEMSPVQIDSSAVATDTTDYVAIDQDGLTSTSTRTVIVQAPVAPPPATISDASTTDGVPPTLSPSASSTQGTASTTGSQ
jgi:hypothetical protein